VVDAKDQPESLEALVRKGFRLMAFLILTALVVMICVGVPLAAMINLLMSLVEVTPQRHAG
jgi:hypothetical protein